MKLNVWHVVGVAVAGFVLWRLYQVYRYRDHKPRAELGPLLKHAFLVQPFTSFERWD